jgi:hypothetical protein
MSRMRTRVAAALIAVAAAFATASVVTASATAADPGVCRDGAILMESYRSQGDEATASAIFRSLVSMGCFARMGPEDVDWSANQS